MKPDPRAVALLEESMEPAEFDRRLALMRADDDEDESIAQLIAWFRRRYPTPLERLRYVTRRMAQLRAL